MKHVEVAAWIDATPVREGMNEADPILGTRTLLHAIRHLLQHHPLEPQNRMFADDEAITLLMQRMDVVGDIVPVREAAR